MDKYEYKLRTEQMLELMEKGAYKKSAEIADSIDWNRVRNATMLINVSDIYEKNSELEKSYDVLNIAYERADGSRKIIYRLCTLALKTGNLDEALDFYDDFMEIAPKDPNQFILRYQILRARKASVEQQIEALESFKKAEYIEEWAFELAKLYQEAGMTAECLEECDDLILWFSEGKYVYQAMELKMQYKPLTPSQQEKYDRRYENPAGMTVTDSIPDLNQPLNVQESAAAAATDKDGEGKEDDQNEAAEDQEDMVESPPKRKIGDTMNLGEALQSLLNPGEKEEANAAGEAATGAGQTAGALSDTSSMNEAIEAIESVADLSLAKDFMDGKIERKTAKTSETASDQIDGQLHIEDILKGWGADTEDSLAIEIAPEKPLEKPKDAVSEMAETAKAAPKYTESVLPSDIQQMIDEIEGNLDVMPDDEPEAAAEQPAAGASQELVENMGAVANDLRIDDEEDDFNDYEIELEDYDDDFEDYDDELEEEVLEEDEFEEDEFEEDELEDDYNDELLSEEYDELPADVESDDQDELLLEDSEELDDSFGDTVSSISEHIEEEFKPVTEWEEDDDRFVADDEAEEEEIDILTATAPLSRKETAKLHATGKTAPLPIDEISDALSMHGRYDLEAKGGIGTRAGLTDEQKKLFSYFVPVRGMSEQLVDVLEQDKNCTNREGSSRTGNLLIIGNKGSGKTVLAVDVVKAIQKQRNIRQGKVAIVTGGALNKKKISEIIAKLYGGALIIEKAGQMNEKTVARLNKALERDTGELLVVLEEQRKPLDRLLSSNKEFRRKFTSRLEVPIFINDELVTFGQAYAQENGYRIDEMGILALYSRIDALQREDHAVTVAEVKELMDAAMSHSQKASAKKLVKRVLGKNTDEADRIILTEKDFSE